MDFVEIKRQLLNFLFPIECSVCGKEDVWLCHDCLLKLALTRTQSCFFCEKINDSGATCSHCAADHRLDGVFVCADYANPTIASLIKKLKYSFARELSEVLAAIAHRYWLELAADSGLKKIDPSGLIIVPIPLHKKRYNWRGFNQAELIAKSLADRLGIPCQNLLQRIRHNTPQAKLSGPERRQNLHGCFAVRENNLRGKKILLIDDVATTGSTLIEAAEVLKAAGARQVWALVIAKG